MKLKYKDSNRFMNIRKWNSDHEYMCMAIDYFHTCMAEVKVVYETNYWLGRTIIKHEIKI